MTIKEFGETIEFNIRHGIKHAVLGLGAPGVGKSQLIGQIGEKFGYKVIDLRLAQMSEVEIGGLIYPNEARTKTVWLAPDVLPDEKRDGEKTILLLDEITSCSKRVQVAAYQLILDRRIGQYRLPEGTFVIGLGNREDDDGVYIQLAGPLADRFEIHYIEPDFEGWKFDYALKNGVHPLVISYLTHRPQSLHTQAVEQGSMTFATPRSWVRVSDILKIDPDVSRAVVRNKIIGNIGENEGRQFIQYCRENKDFISADDFIEGRVKAKDEMDHILILISAVADKLRFLKKAQSMQDLSPEQQALTKKAVAALIELPRGEYIILALKEIMELNRGIVRNVILQTDNHRLSRFIQDNLYALGLEDANKKSKLGLAMYD